MDRYRQHELPETVKRYKQYTDSFQEWLMKTAVQRGVESAAQIAELAKTKKKGQKTYKMSIEQQRVLVDGIADSKEPLSDTSGLRDLKDAIRSRKEVFQYHKHSNQEDIGHSFFNRVLEHARSKLTAFIGFVPVMLKSQDLEDEASTFAVCYFQRDNENDDDNDAEQPTPADNAPQRVANDESSPTPSKDKRNRKALSEKEVELRINFSVLCFLFELNYIREIVRETWMMYRDDELTVITAALVTDLAQSYIQQNTAALVEDLEFYGAMPQLKLHEIVRGLFSKLCDGDDPLGTTSTSSVFTSTSLHYLFCIEAIDHFEAYAKPGTPKEKINGSNPAPELPFLPFLQYYDRVRSNKVKLPIWDNFTESMIQKKKTPDAYLPFGLQIILDVDEITGADYHKIFADVADNGFDIAKRIRTHIDYEDEMWASDNKPDYMNEGNLKFTNVFLSSLDTLLNWMQEIFKPKETAKSRAPVTALNTGTFLTLHPTLAGLSLWTFEKTYNGFSRSKVSWFIVTLCHLYNAALKVGGLDITWPDLDHIIGMHGPNRIFVGGPPTNPKDFLKRWQLSVCVSSRSFADDFRTTNKFLPMAPPEVKKQRGLQPHFPLEFAITKYYGPDKNNDRWLKRHAIFNLLHGFLKEIEEEVPVDAHEDNMIEVQKWDELQRAFVSFATKIMPSKSKNRRKKNHVSPPDFTQLETPYPVLFRIMTGTLEENEFHNGFDFLGFYRRAYNLVLRIRKEVLFDERLQLARRGDIRKDQDPCNASLLTDLFSGLKINPKDKTVDSTGKDVSTDVVPLDQLKRIAMIMRDTICEEGRVELDRAHMRLWRDWDALMASYDADEAEDSSDIPPNDDGLQPPAPRPPFYPEDETVVPEDEASDVEDPTNPAPAHEPTDSDVESETDCDAKTLIVSLRIGGKGVSEMAQKQCETPAKTTSFTNKPHQAYVMDEAEEELQSMPIEATFGNFSEYAPTDKSDHDSATIEKATYEAHTELDNPWTDEPSERTETTPGSRTSKHGGRPKGIFHRLVYSRNALRKRVIMIKGKSGAPRLGLTRRRKGYSYRPIIVTKKRTVSLRCYAACSLARALLGKKSKLQRRLQDTIKAVLAQKVRDFSGVKAAWEMASSIEAEGMGSEDVVWME